MQMATFHIINADRVYAELRLNEIRWSKRFAKGVKGRRRKRWAGPLGVSRPGRISIP